MTTPPFSRPGAIDLSGLRGQPGAAGGSASGRFTVAITSEEQLRSEVLVRSTTTVVLLSFWAARVPESVQLNDTLSVLAEEYDGRFLFATLDVAAHAELAEALGVPGVPLVLVALQGQLAPLLQQAIPASDLRTVVDQVLQAAVANGVTGRAAPVSDEPEPAAAEEPVSRHPEAEAALEAGDFAAAIAGYERALNDNPADDDAMQGLVRTRLVQGTLQTDAAAARKRAADDPDDIETQLTVADLDLLGGNVEDAFGRLLDLVRRLAGDERDVVRQHLLDLFTVVGGDDSRVAKARQRLAAALF